MSPSVLLELVERCSAETSQQTTGSVVTPLCNCDQFNVTHLASKPANGKHNSLMTKAGAPPIRLQRIRDLPRTPLRREDDRTNHLVTIETTYSEVSPGVDLHKKSLAGLNLINRSAEMAAHA